MVIINPKYDFLRKKIYDIPATFNIDGDVIYKDRNEIRCMSIAPNLDICVKRFQRCSFIKQILYSFFRLPKAIRAYTNAIRINELGPFTPEPIACIIETHRGLITDSYLITKKSNLQHTFYEFRDGDISGKEDLIASFAKWAADLHAAGILHKDFSPGNILYDKVDNVWKFEMVDINRVSFQHISKKRGCTNFCRLWGKVDFFEHLATSYAQYRHISSEHALRWMLSARRRFWQNRSREHFVHDETFSIGVIISTYNNPRWLEKVFMGLKYQTHLPNEIIIADDGSNKETKSLIQQYSAILPIKHVWHPDNGFRKTRILNEAVKIAVSDYIIFMDQDLIPRSDFVSMHYQHAKENRFISGGAISIPEQLSEEITESDIKSGNIFSIKWLISHGVKWNWKLSKLWKNKFLCKLLNTLTPTKASWNGGNASTWKKYILQANGFDTRMRYGAEDREFGQRLENLGYRGIQLRYGIPLIHLYHKRPYRNHQDWNNNIRIWRETRKNKYTTTQYGITQ